MSTFDMPKTGTWEQRGGWVVKRLAADLNLTLIQAAGIVGNLGFESRGFTALQEEVPLAGRGGYGWAQWTGPRRHLFERWCVQHHLPEASDEANYGYLLTELDTTFKTTVSRLRSVDSLETAVFTFGQHYERPLGTTPTHLPGNSERLRWARRALDGALAA